MMALCNAVRGFPNQYVIFSPQKNLEVCMSRMLLHLHTGIISQCLEVGINNEPSNLSLITCNVSCFNKTFSSFHSQV